MTEELEGEISHAPTPAGDVILRWTDATGTTWRICRRYVRQRQQWEATIASNARDTWFERERMVLDDKEVFDHDE